MKSLYLPNEELLPVFIDLLHKNATGTLPLRGRSMRPFLEDGRDKALLALPRGNERVGDAVLAEVSPGHYVLHRIVGIGPGGITLRGDGNLHDEHCQRGDIRAVALGFYRKGRTKPDSTSGLKWRAYSWLWMRLFPLRRYLLFALYPHLPRFLTKRKNSTK